MPEQPKISYIEFSKSIKEKYPQYADKDDYVLAEAMIKKYPQYAEKVELKKKDQTEFPEDVVEYYRGSEQEPSVSEQPPQETPTPSELPKDIGSSIEEYKKISEEARTATESTNVNIGRQVVDIQVQEESWWEQKKASWEQRKNQAAGIPYIPQTDKERRRIAETAYAPQETTSLEGLTDSEKRQVQFLEAAASTSLLGKINMLYNPKLQKESSVILKDYSPTQLEETAAHVLGFVFDSPIFMVTTPASGQVGSVLSKSLYKGGVESVKRKLLTRGVDPIIAEAVAYKTGKSTLKGILGKLVERGTSSALTLGSYNTMSDVADQYLEAIASGKPLDDYDWERTLKSGGEGAALGLALGSVGLPFEYATGYVGRAIENTFVKSLAKGGVVAADIAAESIVLGSVEPIMEGRLPEFGDILQGGALVLLMKGAHLPQSRLMESVQSKMARRRDFTEDIPYTPREASQLGIRLDPKQASFDINKKGDKWLKSMAGNREIPILTKMSVLYNEAGLRLNAFAEPASVKVKQEGDNYVVQTFVESKNKKDRFDLLAETVTNNKKEAEKMSLLGNMQIYDNKVKKVVDNMSPSQKGKLYDQIQLMKTEDSMLLSEAQDIPVRLRTPEQHRVVAEYYKMVQKAVDSQLIGDSPTASPIMRDAVSSTNGLLIVKPTTTHTISEPKEGIKNVEPTYSITVGGKTEKFTDKEKFLETLQVLEPNAVKVDITDDIQTADEVKSLLEERIRAKEAETIQTTTEGEIVAQKGDKTLSGVQEGGSVSKKIEEIWKLREDLLTYQKIENEKGNRKDERGVAPSEMGGVDVRGKDIERGAGAQPRYDVRGIDRIVGHAPLREVSISQNEADIIKNTLKDRVVFDVSFEEVGSADKFEESISKSKDGSKYSASVFIYPKEEYETSKKYLTKDGKAGLAITQDGDIISVFSYGEGKGRVPQMIINAIKEGGVSLDHYDTPLTDYYAQFGFVPVARVKWNDEFAPSDWDKEVFKKWNNGEPDVIAMAYHGGNPETLYERVGKFGNVKELLDKTPYVTTFDEAKILQSEYVARVKQQPIGEQPIADEGGVITPDVSSKELLAKAQEYGVVASFELGEVEPARNQLREFFNRNWSALGLSDAQQKNTINAAMKVSTPAQAQKLIDKVLTQSTEALQKQGLKTSEADVEAAFKKHFADLGKQISEKRRETALKTTAKARIKSLKEADAFVEKSWNDFKKANRATMKDMPQRIQNMMRDKAFKMTERNVDTTFEFFKNVMFNQKYADNLNKVGEKLETWKKQKFKGDIKETTEGLTEAQIRARHTYGSGEVKTFLNKMDITSTAMTTRMVEKLNSALDDMMAAKPTYGKIKEFIEEYQDVIENSIVESVTDVSMKEKDIERLVSRVDDFKERFDKLKEKLEAGTVDVSTLMEFQKNRRGYEAALRKFEEKLSLQDKNTIEEALETINEFFESGYSEMTQESIDIYEAALDKVNKEQIAKIRPAQLPNKYAQEVYDEILRVKELMLFEGNTLQEKETAKHRRMMLNPTTVEMINHSIDEMEASGVIPRAFYSSIMDLHTALQAGDFFSLVESIRKGEHTQEGIFKLSPRTERVARKIATDENYLKGQYTTWMDSKLDLETPTDKPLERIFFSKMENAVIRAQTRATENTQGYTKALREAIGMKAKPLTSAKPSYKQQVTQARVGAVLYNLHYADMQEVVPNKRGEEFILKTKDGTEEIYDSYEKAYVEGNNNKGKYINLDFVGDAIRKELHLKAKLSNNTALNNLRKQASVDAYNSFKTDNLEVTSVADVERLLKPAEVKLVKEVRKLLDDTKEQVRIMAHREGKDVKLFKENYFPTQIREAIDNSVISENIMNLTKKASKGEPLEVSGTILPKQKTPTRWADIDVDRVIKSHITDVYLSYELYPIMKQEFKAMNMVQEKIKTMKKEGLDDGFLKLSEMERFVENFKQDRKDRYFTQMQSGKRIEGTYGVKLGNHFVNFTAALDNTAKVAKTAVLADIMRPWLDFSPQILKQITERGWKLGTVKRLLEMRGMFEYLPEGSTMNTWMKEGLTRYGDPGFVWGDQGKAEEFLDKFMGVADRTSKPLGYIQKFDDVYKKLTGEEINAEKFYTDAEYRNDILRSPYFNQADVVASSYINSIHFARTQAALGAMFFNLMQPGTKRYAWMMPVMAYTSQQYKGFNISMGKLMEGQSKMGADTEGSARVVGSVVNGTWYAMNRITVATLTALGLAAVAGRDDIVREQWEKLKNVWSLEGTATNMVGAISGIYLSGGTAVATQLANIGIAALEVRERKVADDPVALKQVQDAREQLKTMVGVGYFNVGDLENGKLGLSQVVNLLAPIVGSFVYELSVAAGETGMGIYEAFNDWKTVTPERRQELAGHVSRVSLYITALLFGGFPTLKDMRRFTQETVKMARKKPFDTTMDTYIKNVDYVKLMDKYVREITSSPAYKLDEKGDIKYRIVDNGKTYPFRTVGEGEEEKAQVKKGLFWQDVPEGSSLQKKASALIKAEQAMETEVEITFDIGQGKDKKEMTYKGKYKDFYRGYKKNEGSWNVVTQLYKDISEEPSESLGLKQKLELFEKVKVEMAKTADAIFKDEYYEAVVANIMKDMRDMKKEFKTLEYDVRKDLFLDNLELN